mmetsp:Transcript_28431/g.85193  ORF Transcript_28431/g.85193 Transcript_28431/m.85193 type:complete len:91 (+) Transcript_28431:331-603(+)
MTMPLMKPHGSAHSAARVRPSDATAQPSVAVTLARDRAVWIGRGDVFGGEHGGVVCHKLGIHLAQIRGRLLESICNDVEEVELRAESQRG